MFVRRHILQPPLSDFVKCVWYSEGASGEHPMERLLPNGEATIVFSLRDVPIHIYGSTDASNPKIYRSAVFLGPRDDSFMIEADKQERAIGIQFRPGGAFPFFSLPIGEIASGSFCMYELWPSRTDQMCGRLRSAHCINDLFAIIEQTLSMQLDSSAGLHPAVKFAIREFKKPDSSGRVSDTVEQVGLSSRRFIELFRDQVGLAPKAFQRLQRFQAALKSLHPNSSEDLAGLASRCGYYDQAHFTHDFKTFSGMTPVEYKTVATAHLNHVPVD